MNSDIARLCLGTAQFGSAYALNGKSRPQEKEIRGILAYAHKHGIRTLDTAASYGAVLQYIVPSEWKIIYKVKARDVQEFRLWSFCDSMLAHEPAAEHLVKAYKAAGFLGKIGESLYWPSPSAAWHQVIQFPLSIADRRYLPLTQKKNKPELYARSVFLQGKLLDMGYSVADCLGFVLRQPVDHVVVGVNSRAELEEILEAVDDLPEHMPDIIPPKLTDQQLDPRIW